LEEFTRLAGLSGDNVCDSLREIHEDGYTVKMQIEKCKMQNAK